jgi:hypothetical protein
VYPLLVVPTVLVEFVCVILSLAVQHTEEEILTLVVLVSEHRVDLILSIAYLATCNRVGSVDVPTMLVNLPSHFLKLVSVRTVVLDVLLTNVEVYHLMDECIVDVLLRAHVVVRNLDTVTLAVSWVATTPESVLLVADDELRLTQLILEILIVVLLECLL